MAIDPSGYGGGGFLFGGNTGYTPEGLAGARQRMAMAMLQQGMNADPIRSPWQGAARMAQALIGGMQMHEMMDQQQAGHAALMSALAGMGQGGSMPAPGAQSELNSSSPSPTAVASVSPSDMTSPSSAGGVPSPDASGQAQDSYRGPQVPANVQTMISQNVPQDMQAYATNLISHESSFNPNAVSPTGATGLAQFTRGTGATYGLDGPGFDNRKDPVANLKALVALTNDNRAGLTQALGRPPTDGELALAHQQGLHGAINLLSGHGVPSNNLAVNGVAPGTDPRVAAAQIMKFYGGSGGTQVASLDPSAGMGGMPVPPNDNGGSIQPPQAPGPATPTPGYVDPTVSAPNYVPPQQPVQPPPGVPGGGNIPVTSSGINQAIAANGGQQNQRPLTAPTASAPSFDPGRGPYPVPESAYASPSQSPAADAINAQAPIDPTQTASISPQAAPQPASPQGNGAIAGLPFPPAPQAPPQTGPSPQLAQAAQSLPPQGNPMMNSPQFRALMAVMTNPYASPGDREMAGMMMQQVMQPQYDFITHDGEVDYVNKRNPSQSGVAIRARPEHVVIGKDPVTGFDRYGWINRATGQIVPDDNGAASMVPPANTGSPQQASPAPQQPSPQPAAPQQAAPQQPPTQTNAPQQRPDSAQNITVPKVPGEDYLDKLAGDPQWAPYVAQARAVLRGDMPLPVGNAATKPTDQIVLRLVTAADPQFNGSVAAARGAAIKDFTNGDNPSSSGGQILAANTAIAHMREAARASEVLGKQQVQFEGAPGGSSVANTLQEKLSPNSSAYHAALTKYNAIVTPMAEELTKFYSGASGTQASRDAMEDVLNPNSTPEQRRGAFQILIGGLQGKTDELQRKWHQSMGPGSQDFPILGPEAKMGINYVNNLGKTLPDTEQSLQNARDAIIGGAPREAVIKKLQDAKIDPARL